MKTFHSSGTPIGTLLMMLRWKHDHHHGRDRGDRSAVAEQEQQRRPELHDGAGVREERRQAGRAQVVGEVRWKRRLMSRRRQTGLLLIIAATTNGKCRLSLEVAAPHQIATMTSLAAMTWSPATNR